MTKVAEDLGPHNKQDVFDDYGSRDTNDMFEDDMRMDVDGEDYRDDQLSASHLNVLCRDECILRLQAHGVGQVSVVRFDRRVTYPVNYIVDGESIVFRTRRGSDLYAATFEAPAALEIDGTDAIYHEGWGVQVVGQASHVHDPRESARLNAARLTPWAGARRNCFVKIDIEEVTGRHIPNEHRQPLAPVQPLRTVSHDDTRYPRWPCPSCAITLPPSYSI